MAGIFKFLYACLGIIVITLLLKSKECQGANILFYVTVAYSHRESIEPLAHKLVERGHNVTFFSCERAARPNPKFAQFCPKLLSTVMATTGSDMTTAAFKMRRFSRNLNIMPSIFLTAYLETLLCAGLYSSQDMKDWIQRHQFDLVILDTSNQKCSYALAYKFGAPTISFTPSGYTNHESEMWGFPGDTSWAPGLPTTNVFTRERTFYDRLYQEVYPLFTKFVMDWVTIPKMDRILRQDLEMPDMPSLKELEERTSLFFVNLHYSHDFPRTAPPFVVFVGGMTCDRWNTSKKVDKLPKHLEDFINGAGDDGFIFLSFGSTVLQMSDFDEDLLNLFFDSVRGRKTRFLWKWDIEPPKNLPENVLTAKWFPQQGLLAHPKIRGFISQGGLMSYHQASCYGVPMIIIPVMYDQPYNALSVQHIHETGIHLEFSEITRESLTTAIDSILNDKTYSENAKIVQQRFMDRPMSPIDLASYWTEYVLRHKNTSHLKPTLAMNQFWWQRRLLDVWLFILIFLIFGSWLTYKIAKFLFHRILRVVSRNKKSKYKQKTN